MLARYEFYVKQSVVIRGNQLFFYGSEYDSILSMRANIVF